MDAIITQFEKKEEIFKNLKTKLDLLIPELLGKDSQVHQVSCRVKERESLINKIRTKGDNYKSLDDITDLVGLRIITYLDSDVDNIAKIIESEFNIDIANSEDKRKLNNNVFGYRSLHYVVSFNEERCKLTEFKSMANIKFEIQIRSILQHAWAEIEHDLGYKGMVSIPDAFKRNFNRLAALLEIADVEFDRLKSELIKYEKDVSTLISKTPDVVDINQASLYSFCKTNDTMKSCYTMAEEYGVSVNYNFHAPLPDMIERFYFLGVITISDLNEKLENNKNDFLKFYRYVLSYRYFNGITLFAPLISFSFYYAYKINMFEKLKRKYPIAQTQRFIKNYFKEKD